MLRYYEIIKEIHNEWEEKFKEFIKELKKDKICLVLFGSKAKGKDNLLSDFDILIITKDKQINFTSLIDFPADVFCYTIEECLKEIDKKNSVVLDAFTQGKVMFDNIDIFNFLMDRVKAEIKESKLVRYKDGWFGELKEESYGTIV